MAVVYKATNRKNGKSYIGFDSNWPNRKHCHLFHAKNKTENTFYFHRAIQKHGIESFDWEIIKEEATLEDEISLIEEHKTFHLDGGYNLTRGGDGNLGWKAPKETRKKISDSARGNKYCLGRVLSEETKQKISNSLRGKPSPKKGKPSPLRGRKQPKEVVEKRISARMKTLELRKSKEQGF